MNIINTPIKVSAEPNGARLVEVHQPLSEKIDDDPQLLPITLNSAMQSFKDAAQTDAEVMQHVMDVRSGILGGCPPSSSEPTNSVNHG